LLRNSLEKFERVGLGRTTPLDSSANKSLGRRHSRAMLIIVVDEIVALPLLQIDAKGIEEAGKIRTAPELAIRDHAQADFLLHRHHLADRSLLDRAQSLPIDFSGKEILPCGNEIIGPQQAPDMIGAKGEVGFFHGVFSLMLPEGIGP
jgi:hypothetical protein